MAQVEIDQKLIDAEGGRKKLDMEMAQHVIGELDVGFILNCVNTGIWTARQYCEVAMALNQIATKANKPPVIWGLDSVHGAIGAIITQQPITLASTWDVSMSYQAGGCRSIGILTWSPSGYGHGQYYFRTRQSKWNISNHVSGL
jgi:hypothetical protein